jgi:hypothetical protein
VGVPRVEILPIHSLSSQHWLPHPRSLRMDLVSIVLDLGTYGDVELGHEAE